MSELKSLFRLTCSDMAVLRYIPVLFHSMADVIGIHQNWWETVTTFQKLIKCFYQLIQKQFDRTALHPGSVHATLLYLPQLKWPL